MKRALILLSFLSGLNREGAIAQHGLGLVWNNVSRVSIKTRAQQVRGAYILPARYSLRNFSPIPGDQQATAGGAAWACAYTAMTLQQARSSGWQGKELITQKAYSPGFIYRLANPADRNCNMGTSIEAVLQCLKYQGALTLKATPSGCPGPISEEQLLGLGYMLRKKKNASSRGRSGR